MPNYLIITGGATHPDGIKTGQSASEKWAAHGATPTVKRTGAAGAAVGAVTTVGSNTGTPGAGLSLIGDTTAVNQAAAIMNDLAALREDLAAVITLANENRATLVEKGLHSGAA